MARPAHQETIVLAASEKIIPPAVVSRFVQLLHIVSWLYADLENNRKADIGQLCLLGAGNRVDSVVEEKTHLNNENDKTSNVEEMESFL